VTLPPRDLDAVLGVTEPFWRSLEDERVLITGGTGFVGSWMVHTFAAAVERFGLRSRVTVMSRNPGALARTTERLPDCIELFAGDVAGPQYPAGTYRYIVSAAANPVFADQSESLRATFWTIVDGTRRTLDFALAARCEAVLLVSSGAVYGTAATHGIAENTNTAPDTAIGQSTYGEAKRAAEMLATICSETTSLRVPIARGFAFVGPYLDSRFAIAGFIRAALDGKPIVVADGAAVRSYMYAADMTTWLWTLLYRGPAGRPYNIGSDEAVTLADAARIVSEAVIPHPVVLVEETSQPSLAGRYYVPDITRARREMGLTTTVRLADAIQRTICFQRATRESHLQSQS
jgi:dTDP-glucose 4,6-dehydratase